MASLMKICSISRPAYRITNQLLAQGTVVVGVNSLSSKFHLLSPRQAVAAPAAAKSVSDNREVRSTRERGNRFENRNVTLQTRERRGQSAIDQHFGELEAQVRTWNHVSERHIEDLLTILQTRGSVSSQQSLMILRCVGSLMLHKSPKDRAIYAAQVWERLSKLGAVFDVTHYNARLRSQLENKDMFSTVSVLEEMEKNGINPNRVTYLLLVARHCEEGDIEGASKIIDFMKSQDMSVNEFVFNALIKGYLRKGDNTNAQEVIKTMKNMGLEPSHETYRVMAEVQAAAGNLSAIRETFEKAKAENIDMKAKHVYSAIVELVLNGHGAKLPEMMELLQDKRLYLNDVRATVAELLVHGHDDAAYTVYTNFTAHSGTSGGQGRILLRTLIQLDRPFEKVIEFQNKLAEAGHRVDDISSLLFFSLGLPKPDYNLNALTVVKSAGEELRAHYYVPIFHNFEESKNKEGIYKTAKHLHSNCKTQEALIRIFTNCVQPLLRLGDSFDTVQQRLKDDTGCSADEIQSVEAAFLVSEGRFKEAQKIVELLQGPVIVRSSFVHGIAKNSNFNEVAELLHSYQPSGKIRDVLSSSILYIINESSLTAEQLGKFITSLVDKQIKINSDLYNPIVEALQKRGVPAKMMEKFDTLVTKGNANSAASLNEDNRHKSVAELEKLREGRISDGAQSTTTIDIELLRKYCFSGNVAKADEMKALLDSRGFIYKPDLLIALASLALVHKKNAAEFQSYKEQLESLYPDSKYKIPLFLFEIGRKINDGASVTDVFDALKKFSEQEKLGKAESREHSDALSFIVTHAQQKWQPADIEQLVDNIVSLNYVTENRNQPVNFVVAAYLKANDIDNAVRVWEKNISPDKRPTMFSAILEKIIQAEDPVRLQKVVDILTSVLGEMVALHHLAKSFVVCGKVKQAQKVFETPGLRAQNLIMKNDANRMARSGQVKELEAYFSVAKDVFLVDKEELLFHLLRAHCVKKDYAKAQEMLTVFEEHNIQPRGRTLRYLANVLQTAGLPVTFSVPEATEGKDDGSQGFVAQKKTSKTTREKSENEPRAVKSNKSPRPVKREAGDKVKEATDKPRKTADKPKEAADKPKRAANKRPEVQKDALEEQVSQWGKEGNVQDIEKMIDDNAVPSSVRRHARKCLLSAYLNSGREQELEKMLRETDVSNLSQLVTSVNLVQLSKKNEALFNDVCSRIVNKQPLNLPALDHVVRTYFLTNRFKEAQDIFAKIPEAKKVVQLKSLCRALHSLPEKESVYNELFNLFKDSPRSREPLNHAILLQCEKGDAKKALNYIENAEKNGLVLAEALWGYTVQSTEKLLNASGLPLPWPTNMLDQCKQHEVKRKEQLAARQASKSSSSA